MRNEIDVSSELGMDHLILGAYATQKHIQVGSGLTAQDWSQRIIWLAAQLPTMDICIQPLNSSHLPSGIVTIISSTEFFQNYFPEADCYDEHIRSKAKQLSEWLGTVGAPLPQMHEDKDCELLQRAFLAILHGASGISMREGELDKLRALVQQAVRMQCFYHFQIGISAAAVRQRKERNYPLAIDFYSRALQIKEDDHLLFNAARTHYEMKNIASATDCLTKALALNPELTVARQFLDFLAASSTAQNQSGKAP
jgi:tetratricopeptide (TPR) repeat protein